MAQDVVRGCLRADGLVRQAPWQAHACHECGCAGCLLDHRHGSDSQLKHVAKQKMGDGASMHILHALHMLTWRAVQVPGVLEQV